MSSRYRGRSAQKHRLSSRFRDGKQHRQIELLPYVVAQTEGFEAEDGNPFATGRSQDLAAGLDGKMAVTSDLTLDFTVNPDFGQVEADPSVVNLTTQEVFFDERRPFFIEGRNKAPACQTIKDRRDLPLFPQTANRLPSPQTRARKSRSNTAWLAGSSAAWMKSAERARLGLIEALTQRLLSFQA